MRATRRLLPSYIDAVGSSAPKPPGGIVHRARILYRGFQDGTAPRTDGEVLLENHSLSSG